MNYEIFSDILFDNFVLTNNSDMVCDVKVGELISDHNIITVIMSTLILIIENLPKKSFIISKRPIGHA